MKKSKINDEIKIELLKLSQREHWKSWEDICRSLGAAHPKAVQLQKAYNEITEELKKLNV